MKEKENKALKNQIEQSGSEAEKDLQQRNEELVVLKDKMSSQAEELDLLKSQIVTKDESFNELRGSLSVSEKNIKTLSEL